MGGGADGGGAASELLAVDRRLDYLEGPLLIRGNLRELSENGPVVGDGHSSLL